MTDVNNGTLRKIVYGIVGTVVAAALLAVGAFGWQGLQAPSREEVEKYYLRKDIYEKDEERWEERFDRQDELLKEIKRDLREIKDSK